MPSTSTSPVSTGSSSSSPSSSLPPIAVAGDEIHWDRCFGLGIPLIGPQAIYQGKPVPSWEEGADAPTNEIHVSLFQCERISWANFERGPISMLFEWDGNLNNPSSCAGGHVDGRGVLDSIWFSDPDLAAYAKAEYAMPAVLGTFTYNSSSTPEGQQIHWTWAAAPNEASDASQTVPPVDHRFSTTDGIRLFWYNGKGVNRMDFWREFEQQQVQSATSGTMQPPMLWATQGPVKQYSETGAFKQNGSMNATLARYDDLACKQPV
jgi:hypothetical protein